MNAVKLTSSEKQFVLDLCRYDPAILDEIYDKQRQVELKKVVAAKIVDSDRR